MAWADLYADAALFLPFNGNDTPILNTTASPNITISAGNQGTAGIARVYENDAPPNSGYTQSYRLNGYSTTPQNWQVFNGLQTFTSPYYGNAWEGETVSFWFKVDSNLNPQNVGNAINFVTCDVPGTTNDDLMRFTGGGTNFIDPAGTVGKFTWTGMQYVTSASNATTWGDGTALTHLEPGRWYHIAYVYSEQRNAATGLTGTQDLERAIYINGQVVHHRFFSNTNGLQLYRRTKQIIPANTGTLTNATQKISSFAIFNKPLTPAQIRNLYLGEATPTTNYNQVVLDDNPVYYVTLNNPDKNTPTDVYGSQASNWGALNDDADLLEVNQESKFGKSWLIKHSPTNVQIYNMAADKPNMLAGLGQLLRTQEYTFEYWFKTDLLPTAGTGPRGIWTMGASSTSAPDGYIATQFGTTGVPRFQYTIRTGTSTYSGTANSTWLSSSTNIIDNTNPQYFHYMGDSTTKRFANGQWNHVVFTLSRSEGVSQTPGSTIRARLYVNGVLLSAGTAGSQFLSETGVALWNWAIGSDQAGSTVNRDYYIDKIAVYPRKLSQHEVMDHYLAGATFLASQPTAVKYWDGTEWQTSSAQKVWNGTSWIDWDMSYWNGTSWVQL